MEPGHHPHAEPARESHPPGAAQPQSIQTVPASREGSPSTAPASSAPPAALAPAPAPLHPWRKWALLAVAGIGLAVAGYFLWPTLRTMLNTVSTDDAYVQ